MRIPHTVPQNTFNAYSPSEQTLTLAGEQNRKLRSESWAWDENIPPTLTEFCIRSLVDAFDEHRNVLPHLELYDLDVVLETLPKVMPLDVALPLIQDGNYWKRRCLHTWDTMNDITRYDNSWKRMFAERYLEDLIELEEPGYTDWIELGNTLKLCFPYVKRLEITQLKPPRIMKSEPIAPDLCSAERFIPEHIDLSPILSVLENLEVLNLQFGVKDIGMNFMFESFKVHVSDIENLGKGLKVSRNLRTLRLTCSDIDDMKLNIILKSLESCEFFEELEVAHCKLTDVGAKSLGHFLTIKRHLKSLKIPNNMIQSKGAEALAYAFTLDTSAYLEMMDFKFNLIGEEGGRCMAAALAKSRCPRRLILAGCGLGEASALDLANMLRLNTTLQELDLSNNLLRTSAGQALISGLEDNLTLMIMDVRNCGIDEDSEKKIHELTHRNREQSRKNKEFAKKVLVKESRRGFLSGSATSESHTYLTASFNV